MQSGVEFIKEFSAKGERVLVHCKGGHGRAGAVTMAWLLSNDADATPESVQAFMSAR